MKTIIAGSRGIGLTRDGRQSRNTKYLRHLLEQLNFKITCVVSGTAKGVDTLGEVWAKEENIPIERYPADWDQHGKAAGHIRNSQMANNAEALVAVWDGVSRGTKNMIDTARLKRLRVTVFNLKDKSKLDYNER